MADPLDIINSALGRTGNRKLSSYPDAGVTESDVTVDVYSDMLNAELAAYPWDWSKKTEDLSGVAAEADHRYDYSWDLPSDFVRTRDLWHDDSTRINDFVIEGLKLYCDYGSLISMTFTYQAASSVWSPLFREGFIQRLGAHYERELNEDRAAARDMDNAADRTFMMARTGNAQNVPQRYAISSRLVERRRNG